MPSGGVKDVTSPKVVSAQPENQSVNFNSKLIYLEFDEYVVGPQINTELIANPPLPEGSEAKVRGKALEIALTDSLRAYTTYILSFRNGVKDLNEGNSLDSNIWVFSTGSYLDSGIISGNVKGAFDNQFIEGMWLLLYEKNSDSLPIKEQPSYQVQSDAEGNFSFKFLPPQKSFKLFALKDENADYLFSLPTEIIAFSDQPIESGNDSIQLNAFQERNKQTYISDFKQIDPKFIRLKFSAPIQNFALKGVNFEVNYSIGDQKLPADSLILELSYDEKIDSLSLQLTLDSINIDTTDLESTFIDSTSLFIDPVISQFVINSNALKLRFRRIVNFIGSKSFQIIGEDSLSLPGDFTIELPDSMEGAYKLIIPDSCFCNLAGICNDSLVYNLDILRPASAPDLILSLPIRDDIRLELLNGQKEVLRSEQASSRMRLSDLAPGSYYLRMIVDKNGNGYWDSGNYLKGVQPEKVFYYPTEIQLKKGFDMEIDWDPFK